MFAQLTNGVITIARLCLHFHWVNWRLREIYLQVAKRLSLDKMP